MDKLVSVLFITVFVIVGCQFEKTNNIDLGASKYKLLSPDTLISQVFDDSDIVFLGEAHRRKEHVDFVNSILPSLYEHGVRVVFSEFTNYAETSLADSIITASEYDEHSARNIIQASGWDWAYQEYVDLYKAAWLLNSSLEEDQEPLRIVGLQPDINYAAIKSEADWDSPQKRQAYWNETDSTSWLAIIEKEALSKKQKALVYCGRHHAFSKFHHPIVIGGEFLRFEKDREGTQLLNRYQGKVSTVLLHSFWNDQSNIFPTSVSPFNAILDTIYSSVGNNKAYGFQCQKSELGDLVDSTSLYSVGRDTVRLKDICDAYIVLSPVCELSLVSIIPDFIDESNFENAKIQDYPYNFYDHWTIEAMNDTIQEWYKIEAVNLNLMKQYCD